MSFLLFLDFFLQKKSILPESGKVKVPSELEFVRKPPLSLSFPLDFEEIVMDRILPGISGSIYDFPL